MENNKQKELIKQTFEALDFNLIFYNEKENTNGPDCFVQKGGGLPLAVEIKTIKKNKTTGAWSVPPVEKARTTDHLIAIIINEKYVIIEPMEQHLKSCSPSGYRPLTLLS